MTAQKITSYLMYVLLILGAVFFILSLVNDTYNPMLYYGYILFGACLVIAVLASLATMIIFPKNLKQSVIGLVAFLIVAGVGYGMASGKVLTSYDEGITETVSKLSGTGLYMLYILFGVAVLSIVFSGFSKMLK